MAEDKKFKVFIGGLHLSTDNDSLKTYFEGFGEIVDCIVMKDGATRKSRGFGFVTYSSGDAIEKCLEARPHLLDGKEVEVKIAVPREEENNPSAHSKTRKVFLGGLAPDTTEDDIMGALDSSGKILDVQIMTDKETNKPRGFGFATFESMEVVDRLCLKKYIRIKDRNVEVKKAVSQDEMRGKEPRGRSGGPPGGQYGGSRDQYGSSREQYGGSREHASAYGGVMGSYDYSRYPGGAGAYYRRPDPYARMADPYARSGTYTYDQATAAASAYYGMYGAGAMPVSSYSQSPSGYGPSRSSYGTGSSGGGGGDYGRNYHPYRRTQ